MTRNVILLFPLSLALSLSQSGCDRPPLSQQDEALFRAIREGNTTEVQRLIAAGANVRARDQHGNTPLHIAASGGRCVEMELLIEHGARVRARNDHDSTPLHSAATNCRMAASRILIEAGANVNASDECGQIPIFAAAKGGSLELVKFLIDNGSEVPKEGLTPLHFAACGHFLSYRDIEQRHMNMVHFFLDQGVDVNATADTMFGTGTSILHCATFGACKPVVNLLIERGADVNAKSEGFQQTPLFGAALAGNKSAAEALIASGADVNATDFRGRTPLHSVVWHHNLLSCHAHCDRLGLVQLLLTNGAEVNVRDRSRSTPLHLAVGFGWRKIPQYRSIIKVLLAHGANPNTEDGCGRTPLELAGEDRKVARLLLRYGAKER